MFTIRFNSPQPDVTLIVEKRGHARIITDAIKAAGMTPEVTVNKLVDLTPKPRKTPATGKTGKKK